MDSLVTIVNSTILHLKVATRVDLISIHQEKQL